MISFEEKTKTRIQTEEQLLNQSLSFTATYLAIQYIETHIENAPEFITKQTTLALLNLVESNRFESKKQSYFLYKEAAFALIKISLNITHPLAGFVVFKLQNLLIYSKAIRHRAISEALGSLPLNIAGPIIQLQNHNEPLKITFDSLMHHCGNPHIPSMQWHGRTLRLRLNCGKIVCIKFSKSIQNSSELLIETHWLDFLKKNPPCRKSKFKIPVPICINQNSLFKLTKLPEFILNHQGLNQHIAIVFITDDDYFSYPNDPDLLEEKDSYFQEIFQRNAWLLGKLTSKGIIHTAIIPLFHNRVQQQRREDHGVYNWEQGGRLDRWLDSCQYPNFAASGLRDFEHIISIDNTKRLHHFIGEHILGFILVLGSFFRNKAPKLKGYDGKGTPVDTRSLFDRSLFGILIKDIVVNYYQGLTGISFKKIDHFLDKSLLNAGQADINHTDNNLIDDLIESMGIDRYMEETLRIQDQSIMNDVDFKSFLNSRGYGKSMLKNTKRGKSDIVLATGPHLGGFNQPICVPKLIDFLFCLSSLCISDRYIMENGLKAS